MKEEKICNFVEVVEWMKNKIEMDHYLSQETAAIEINNIFGNKCSDYNIESLNLVINKDVLKEFKKITKSSVVWIRSKKEWRLRDNLDSPGRQQN